MRQASSCAEPGAGAAKRRLIRHVFELHAWSLGEGSEGRAQSVSQSVSPSYTTWSRWSLVLASRCRPPDRILMVWTRRRACVRPRWTAADHSGGTKPGFLLGASAASHQRPPRGFVRVERRCRFGRGGRGVVAGSICRRDRVRPMSRGRPSASAGKARVGRVPDDSRPWCAPAPYTTNARMASHGMRRGRAQGQAG